MSKNEHHIKILSEQEIIFLKLILSIRFDDIVFMVDRNNFNEVLTINIPNIEKHVDDNDLVKIYEIFNFLYQDFFSDFKNNIIGVPQQTKMLSVNDILFRCTSTIHENNNQTGDEKMKYNSYYSLRLQGLSSDNIRSKISEIEKNIINKSIIHKSISQESENYKKRI